MPLVWQALLQRPTRNPDVSEKASELSTQNRIPGPPIQCLVTLVLGAVGTNILV